MDRCWWDRRLHDGGGETAPNHLDEPPLRASASSALEFTARRLSGARPTAVAMTLCRASSVVMMLIDAPGPPQPPNTQPPPLPSPPRAAPKFRLRCPIAIILCSFIIAVLAPDDRMQVVIGGHSHEKN